MLRFPETSRYDACMNSFSVSAPGSLMLLGEHAVLHGHLAMACAVSERLRVRLTPLPGREVEIVSNLGQYRSELDVLDPEPAFRFVLAAIRGRRRDLPSGFRLTIESDFSHQVGLGSSAAVTVAVHAAMDLWRKGAWDEAALVDAAVQTIREVQGRASGTDAAASVYGGLIAYRAEPRWVRPLDGVHPLTVVYSGSKTPTADVIRLVEEARQRQTVLFADIFHVMDRSIREAIAAVKARDWAAVGRLLNLNQGLMEAIGVGSARLAELVYRLRAEPGILGAKISGSGLGDCVIGLGAARAKARPEGWLPVEMSRRGVDHEPA